MQAADDGHVKKRVKARTRTRKWLGWRLAYLKLHVAPPFPALEACLLALL